MSEIQTLQPNLLWKWFAQVCAIPHPSYHEDELATFILNWAKSKGFYAERDEVGNVLIRKPATAGMENRQPVALQAHLDMVPQANANSSHNFKTDPIRPYIDSEWVKATGTTLGADNGIGLASALAVLESENLAHPDLEVLLTMTEESGMEGAIGLHPNWLRSELMINTDTEENGEIYIGCAGGVNANLKLPFTLVANPFSHCYQISLKGLRGGHSGVDIHTGRGNAIKIMARLLADLNEKLPIRLAKLQGGSVRNAIPREAFATVAIEQSSQSLFAAVREFEQLLQKELALIEPNLTLNVEEVPVEAQILDEQSTTTAIHFFNALPNGVMRNSDAVKGVVESSLSVGVLKQNTDKFEAIILVRSLVESGKAMICSQLSSLCALSGAEVAFSADYPGWEPDAQSPLLSLTKEIYDQILGYEAKVKVIHAGLECGLLKKTYPHIAMISVGPTIENAHSPDEKVHIPAVETYWALLTKMLASIPVKA